MWSSYYTVFSMRRFARWYNAGLTLLFFFFLHPHFPVLCFSCSKLILRMWSTWSMQSLPASRQQQTVYPRPKWRPVELVSPVARAVICYAVIAISVTCNAKCELSSNMFIFWCRQTSHVVNVNKSQAPSDGVLFVWGLGPAADQKWGGGVWWTGGGSADKE